MNNLKGFEKFNEELKFDTYTNAAKRLNLIGHEGRSKELVKHALNMKNKQYGEREYTLWPDKPVVLKDIKADDKRYGVYFFVTFKDIEREHDLYNPRFEFYYARKHDLRPDGEDFFRFTSSKEDFDGDETIYRLFTNRQDAMKFKKMFGQWLMENGHEECIPAFNRMSINTLYTGEKPNIKHHRKYSDD